jgi:hypothetical protein
MSEAAANNHTPEAAFSATCPAPEANFRFHCLWLVRLWVPESTLQIGMAELLHRFTMHISGWELVMSDIRVTRDIVELARLKAPLASIATAICGATPSMSA